MNVQGRKTIVILSDGADLTSEYSFHAQAEFKSRREKYTTGTVFDDAFEFGLGMEGRNQSPGEAPSFFKFILNFLKAGEYRKMYPSIGQYLYNWRPEMDIATKLERTDDAQYFNLDRAEGRAESRG